MSNFNIAAAPVSESHETGQSNINSILTSLLITVVTGRLDLDHPSKDSGTWTRK
jgi:hypothetical protein